MNAHWRKLVPSLRLAGKWSSAILVLFIVYRSYFLLFHIIAEGFALGVALLTDILATRTYKYTHDNFLLFLGNAFFFVAVLNFGHLITYEGMGIFGDGGINVSTQFWVAGRYVLGLSLLLAPFFIRNTRRRAVMYLVYAVAVGLIVTSIVWLPVFPTCYVEGQGYTAFKFVGEGLTGLFLLGAILQLRMEREQNYRSFYRVMILAMTFMALSQLSFAVCKEARDLSDFAGHSLRVMAYYLIYRGIILRCLEAPYDTIFKELKDSCLSDYLTGLYNRQGFMEVAGKALVQAGEEKRSLGIVLINIDGLDLVNDECGRHSGDLVLKLFGDILRSSIRETDIACRLEGTKFVALLAEADAGSLEAARKKLWNDVQAWTRRAGTGVELCVNIGSSLWDPRHMESIEALIRRVDEEVNNEKKKKTRPRIGF